MLVSESVGSVFLLKKRKFSGVCTNLYTLCECILCRLMNVEKVWNSNFKKWWDWIKTVRILFNLSESEFSTWNGYWGIKWQKVANVLQEILKISANGYVKMRLELNYLFKRRSQLIAHSNECRINDTLNVNTSSMSYFLNDANYVGSCFCFVI